MESSDTNQPLRGSLNCNLPVFWSQDVTGWFAHIESRFRAKRIFDEWDRFDLVVQALPLEVTRLNKDAIRSPDEDEPYTILKEQLVHQHGQTDFQKIEALMALPPLGNRKPTELLGEMMELCPDGQEANLFFSWAFTSRLPAWLRVQLAEEDYDQVRRLAVKADRLWAAHGVRQQQAVAAAMPLPEEDYICAVQPSRAGGRKGGRPAATPAQSAAASAQSEPRSRGKRERRRRGPAEAARLAAGLCLEHWLHGRQADHHRCFSPCKWAGN